MAPPPTEATFNQRSDPKTTSDETRNSLCPLLSSLSRDHNLWHENIVDSFQRESSANFGQVMTNRKLTLSFTCNVCEGRSTYKVRRAFIRFICCRARKVGPHACTSSKPAYCDSFECAVVEGLAGAPLFSFFCCICRTDTSQTQVNLGVSILHNPAILHNTAVTCAQ